MKKTFKKAACIVSAAALLIAAAVFGGVSCRNRSGGGDVVFASRNAMGTFLNFWVDASGADTSAALEICAAAVDRVSASLSVFDPQSVTARLNVSAGNGEWIETGREFEAVLDLSLFCHDISGGAFNPAVGPLMELWGFARGGVPGTASPDSEEVAHALELADVSKIAVIDVDGNGRAMLLAPGMRLDFGAVAKGFGTDCAYADLRAAGITNFIVDIGGNMRFSGSKPSGGAWTAGVRDPCGDMNSPPVASLFFRDGGAVSTSGSYEQFSMLDGVRRSHIIDPRTGMPVETDLLQVTVIADSAALADALSTACFVLGYEKGADLLAKCGAYGIFAVRSGDGFKLLRTPGTAEKYERPEPDCSRGTCYGGI